MKAVFGFGGECSGGGRFVRESGWMFGFGDEGTDGEVKIPLFWRGLRFMLDKNGNVCYNGSIRG